MPETARPGWLPLPLNSHHPSQLDFLQLPPELLEKILSYLSKNEILKLRRVNKQLLLAVPEKYLHQHILNLLYFPFYENKYYTSPAFKKLLSSNLHFRTKWSINTGVWYTALRITPHVECFGKQPRHLRASMKLWLLKRTSLLQRAATKVNHILCTRIIPSTPNVTTLCVIEQSSGYLKKITERLIPPPRCAYIDIAWSQYSATLTNLEIVVRRDNQWPSYRPADEISLPSLQRLWVLWHTGYWPEIATFLVSKAPNLVELGMSYLPKLSEPNLFPMDPESLCHLRVFRWLSWNTYTPPHPHLGLFLKSFSPQLTQVSFRGFSIDLTGEQTIDISKLHSFSLDQGLVGPLELGILAQLETPGLCNSLRRFVLRCPLWGARDVERLFDALAYLRDSLRELFLHLPFYSTTKLIHLAKSTPRLESLHIVTDWWYTHNGQSRIQIPHFSDLADEVRSIGPQSLELRAWKLLDLTIRQRIMDSPSNKELMDAIASFVPSIYSFYGLGHKTFQPSIKRPLPDVDIMSMECGTSSWIQDDL